MYSFITEFVWAFLPGPKPLEFYLCKGRDPTEFFQDTSGAIPYLRIFSILLHIVLYSRIMLFKRRSTVGPQSHGLFLKNMALADIEAKSLTNCFVNVGLVSFSVSTTTMLITWSSRIKTSIDSTTFPNYLFIYFYYLVSILPTSFYHDLCNKLHCFQLKNVFFNRKILAHFLN